MQTSERVDVLGYHWLRNDNGYRFQRKLRHKAKRYQHGKLKLGEINPCVQSWIGHARHGETERLRAMIFDRVTLYPMMARSTVLT
ncbi:MAG: hypothetical protein V7629_11035 [Motiliproteus sp.]